MGTKNVSNRWCKDRVEISKTADKRKRYLVSVPVGEAFLGVYVRPNKQYGEFSGKQLISMYLSRWWKKGDLPHTGAKRQSDYLHKPRYGNNRTRADWERVNRLGNPRNDLEFRKHQEKLKELEGNIKGKKDYLRKLERMKKKLKYNIGNQTNAPSEETDTERRERQQREIETGKITPYTRGDVEDEEEE